MNNIIILFTVLAVLFSNFSIWLYSKQAKFSKIIKIILFIVADGIWATLFVIKIIEIL